MAFDVNKFLNTEYTEAFDTKRPLIPEGDWRGYIKSIDVSPGNRPSVVMVRLTVEYDDDDLKAHPSLEGRDKIVKNETLFVDVDEDTGLIKYGGGSNWMLGQVRAAAGQNDPSRPWAPGQLEGAGPVITRITHRELKKEDASGRKVGTGEYIDNIVSWAAA